MPKPEVAVAGTVHVPESRPGSIDSMISRCQMFAGLLPDAESATIADALRGVAARLPIGSPVPERLLARTLLVQAVSQVARQARFHLHGALAALVADLASVNIGAPEWATALEAAVDSAATIVSEQGGRLLDARVLRTLGFIERRYSDPELALSDAAKHVRLSSWHLAKLIRTATGRTFVEHVRERRVRAARELLVKSELSVKEIAAKVGYNTPTQLNRDFQRLGGTTPSTSRALGRSPSVRAFPGSAKTFLPA